MGKKGKPDEPEQYEIWISSTEGWRQIHENGNGGVFPSKNRALILAEQASHGEGVVETMVISRRPVAVFNGEAIGTKHKLGAVEKKKEIKDAALHGGGQKAVDVPDAGPELKGEVVPDRP